MASATTDWVAAISSAVSAATVLAGGGGFLLYYQFAKDRPYTTRCNLQVKLALITHAGVDYVQVDVAAMALGKAALQLHEKLGAFVAVYRVHDAMTAKPPDWATLEPDVAVRVCAGQDVIEAGETLGDVALIRLERQSSVVAYRVVFVLAARPGDGDHGTPSWEGVELVPLPGDHVPAPAQAP